MNWPMATASRKAMITKLAKLILREEKIGDETGGMIKNVLK
jgi:hypothetical protein